METQQGRANKEPRLCVVRRFEGLIERASWVKSKRRGCQLTVGLRLQAPNGDTRKIHEVFSGEEADENRLNDLCHALGIDRSKFCLDDLVGRKVEVEEKAPGSKTGLNTMLLSYFPMEKGHLKQKKSQSPVIKGIDCR
jgi:hypothetical protein